MDPCSVNRRVGRLVLMNWLLILAVLVLAAVQTCQLWLSATAADPATRTSGSNSVESVVEGEGSSATLPPLITPVVTPRGDLAEDEKSTRELFRAASPSVVHITTHRVERDFFTLDVYKIPRGSGTGFVWDHAGHIVTNFHVIRDADIAYVAFADQSSYSAKLVGVARRRIWQCCELKHRPRSCAHCRWAHRRIWKLA